MNERQMRLDDIVRQAELKLDLFYKDHGEWDGQKERPFRRKGVLHVPDQENDEDPENEENENDNMPPEIPDEGMTIIENPDEVLDDNPDMPSRIIGGGAPARPAKASKKPTKPQKSEGRAKSSPKLKPKKKPSSGKKKGK